MQLDKVEDTRTSLDKLRRVQLLEILKNNGEAINPNTPATALRQIITSLNIDIHAPPKKADPSSLSFTELRAYVGSKGIKVMPDYNKEKLLQILDEHNLLNEQLEAVNGENAA